MYAADARHPDRSLQQKLESIYTLKRDARVALSFRDEYINLLRSLGDPHKKLPPVIHVAGTNGKGSTIAFMRAILEASGYRVHVYTSPHLKKFNERIVLAGEEISDEALHGVLDETLAANNGAEATFFELTTALAFHAFSRTPADIVLLETGLGGRLDCTNIVEAPAATVITRIGYDHMEFLGDSIEAIAGEKAGIIKAGAPCILASQDRDEAAAVIRRVAAEKGAALIESAGAALPDLPLSLAGAYQLDNARTAVVALQSLKGFSISEDAVRAGLGSARWPARLQALPAAAFGLHGDISVILDGGHNESAARALIPEITEWKAAGARIYLVSAMVNKRDPGVFLHPLLPFLDGVAVSPIPEESGSHGADAMKGAVIAGNFPEDRVASGADPMEAVKRAAEMDGPGKKIILIAGSLYLAGWILKKISA